MGCCGKSYYCKRLYSEWCVSVRWFQENSEVSSAEFFPDAQDRRRTGPVVGVLRKRYRRVQIISWVSKTCLLCLRPQERSPGLCSQTKHQSSRQERNRWNDAVHQFVHFALVWTKRLQLKRCLFTVQPQKWRLGGMRLKNVSCYVITLTCLIRM